MPEIKLTIDCGEELCRNCRFIIRNPWNGKALSFCKLFHGKDLKQKGRGFVRCRECLDAETKVPAAPTIGTAKVLPGVGTVQYVEPYEPA